MLKEAWKKRSDFIIKVFQIRTLRVVNLDYLMSPLKNQVVMSSTV